MDGKYLIIIQPEARKDIIAFKKSGNKALFKKIEKILLELQEHPFLGTGKPEPLKYDLE